MNYKVQHHTEFIAELLGEGKLKVTGDLKGIKITYHDPCYLGRANNVYDIPRELIKSLGVDLVEMKRVKGNHFVVVLVVLKCLKNQKMEHKTLI